MYVVNFSESQAYKILSHAGLTNCGGISADRDSKGAALLIQYEQIGTSKRGALAVTESGVKVIDVPPTNGYIGFFDNFTTAYSFEGDFCLFSNGQRLPRRGKSQHSHLNVIGCPGNEILAIGYSDDPDYAFVRARDPLAALFHINVKTIWVRKIFFRNNTVFLFGLVADDKERNQWECWTFRENAGKWERQSQVIIPDMVAILDLDPESPNVLCSRWGPVTKKGFLFNLETKMTSRTGVDIWRDHGYFLREGVVGKIEAALEGKSVTKEW
jgi:hypothetical protein